MKLRRSIALTVAAGAAILMAAPSAASAAPSAPAPTGTRSLAAVLTANGNGQFDGNPFDYDIVTQAVLAVVAAKPASPVALLTKGDVALTAFLPPDFAFRDLVRQLTSTRYASEQEVFTRLVAAVGNNIDVIETVLLYHVVPGATLTSTDALNADNAALTTAQGGTVTVDVVAKWLGLVKLVDQDTNDANPYLNPFALNINKGNKQIAHGITAVLRPLDLP